MRLDGPIHLDFVRRVEQQPLLVLVEELGLYEFVLESLVVHEVVPEEGIVFGGLRVVHRSQPPLDVVGSLRLIVKPLVGWLLSLLLLVLHLGVLFEYALLQALEVGKESLLGWLLRWWWH